MSASEAPIEGVPSGVSRRTLVKGMAWSVPVIAMSSSLPAYAVTGPPPEISVRSACKQSGGSCDPPFLKGYTFLVDIYNPGNETIYIYTDLDNADYAPFLDVIDKDGDPFLWGTAQYYVPGPPPDLGGPVLDFIEVPPMTTVSVYVDAGPGNNSAQNSANGVAFFAWGHTSVAGADPDHPYTPAPPTTPPGEGWVGGTVSFASFNPCPNPIPDNQGNAGCLPAS